MEELLLWFIVGAIGGWFFSVILLFFWEDKIFSALDRLHAWVRRRG